MSTKIYELVRSAWRKMCEIDDLLREVIREYRKMGEYEREDEVFNVLLRLHRVMGALLLWAQIRGIYV